jgi:hypothetical protein
LANRKSSGARILLWSASTSCAIILLYLFLLAFTIIKLQDNRTFGSVTISALFFLPFFLHGAFIIYFLKRYYPAGEIPRINRVIFKIIALLVIILLALLLLTFTVSAFSEEQRTSFKAFFLNVYAKIFASSLVVVVVTQIHMVFAGKRLVDKIQNNYHNSLLNNW